MVYCGTNWSGWECGDCLGGDFDGHGEFFGGVEQGGRFYLTRLTFTPNAGFESSKHRTHHTELPNITDSGTEYKCVFISGSQMGSGAGLPDFANHYGADAVHAYAWFQTNWIPVGDSISDPLVVPRAGLARVKIQNCDTTSLAANPENNEFTLVNSWLINDKNGNPEHWDEQKKLCHYYTNDPESEGGERRKTCCGPVHFAWFEQMKPTATQHRLTYWNLDTADAIELTWTSPEELQQDHGWLLGNFDKDHFPACVEFAKKSERSSATTGITYSGINYCTIGVFSRCFLPDLTEFPNFSLPGNSSGVIHRAMGLGAPPLDVGGYPDVSSSLGTWINHVGAFEEYEVYDEEPENRPKYVPVQWNDAIFYCTDFAIGPKSFTTTNEFDGDVGIIAENGPDYHTNGEPSLVTCATGFLIVGRLARTGDGSGHDLLGNSRWPLSTGIHGGNPPQNYTSQRDTGFAPIAMSMVYGGFAKGFTRNPDMNPFSGDKQNLRNAYEKWSTAHQAAPIRIFGSIYPMASLSDERTMSVLRRGGLATGALGAVSDDYSSFGTEYDNGSGSWLYQQPVTVNGVSQYKEIVAGEYVMQNAWQSFYDDSGYDVIMEGYGRFILQGVPFPVSASDGLTGNVLQQDSIIDQGLVGSSSAPAEWNDNFPFVNPDLSGTTRYTDCLYCEVLGQDRPDYASNPYEINAGANSLYSPIGDFPFFDVWNYANWATTHRFQTSHVSDTGQPYAPRGVWRDSSGTYHNNGILSAGGPLITGLVR